MFLLPLHSHPAPRLPPKQPQVEFLFPYIATHHATHQHHGTITASILIGQGTIGKVPTWTSDRPDEIIPIFQLGKSRPKKVKASSHSPQQSKRWTQDENANIQTPSHCHAVFTNNFFSLASPLEFTQQLHLIHLIL